MARHAVDLPLPQRIDRTEFIARRWVYKRGEHLTIIAPTQNGKTTLAMQLAAVTARPALPGLMLVMKPRDETVSRWVAQLGWRVTRSWPPLGQSMRHPPGWALWPKPTYDPRIDNWTMHQEFGRAILDSYRRGNRIIFADELYGLVNELRLTEEVQAVWTRGSALGCGLWTATQRPASVPLYAYNAAEHLFLSRDPDKRNRDRFCEIGGIDPDLIKAAVMTLRKYEFLYIRRSGPQWCIISA